MGRGVLTLPHSTRQSRHPRCANQNFPLHWHHRAHRCRHFPTSQGWQPVLLAQRSACQPGIGRPPPQRTKAGGISAPAASSHSHRQQRGPFVVPVNIYYPPPPPNSPAMRPPQHAWWRGGVRVGQPGRTGRGGKHRVRAEPLPPLSLLTRERAPLIQIAPCGAQTSLFSPLRSVHSRP